MKGTAVATPSTWLLTKCTSSPPMTYASNSAKSWATPESPCNPSFHPHTCHHQRWRECDF
jgi:hypothetical protein